MSIKSFGDDASADLWHGRNTARVRRFPADIRRPALRKLTLLNDAVGLGDLAYPGNNLEALKGKWKGYHSIRVNSQWRIVFRWTKNEPEHVSLTDYHY